MKPGLYILRSDTFLSNYLTSPIILILLILVIFNENFETGAPQFV